MLRVGELLLLAHDDIYVQRLIDEGKLTHAEALSHPRRMPLIKALHPSSTTPPQVSSQRVQRGDRYLLCTDGLHLPVGDDDILRALADHQDLESAVAELGALAHRAGAPDNLVCVVADVLAA